MMTTDLLMVNDDNKSHGRGATRFVSRFGLTVSEEASSALTVGSGRGHGQRSAHGRGSRDSGLRNLRMFSKIFSN